MANIFLVFYICGAHWRHPANTTEPSVCGGVAALCQVTLTTCYYYYRTVPRSELRKVLFLALSVTFHFFHFVCESNISGTAERT